MKELWRLSTTHRSEVGNLEDRGVYGISKWLGAYY